jgi:alpha-ribazole phosphatase
MAERLLLIRHGEVEETGRGRYIGRTDLALSAQGRRQAAALAPVLAPLAGLRSLASPLARTCQTAEIALGSQRPFSLDEALQEIDFGRWEGKRFEEIAAGDPDRVREWAALAADFSFPGGEAFGAFQERVVAAAERMIADPAETVVAFTHGGVIRLAVCHFLGLEARDFLRFDVEPASLTEFRRENGEWGLFLLNGRHHLGL